jgi:hypothetical protein
LKSLESVKSVIRHLDYWRRCFFTRFYHAYADEWGMATAPVDPNALPGPPPRRPPAVAAGAGERTAALSH